MSPMQLVTSFEPVELQHLSFELGAKLSGHMIFVNMAAYDLQWRFMSYTMATYDLHVAHLSVPRPSRVEICVKFSFFHTVFAVNFW